MPSPLKITCPNCDAHLKLPDRKKVGKKIPCPKCKEPFVIEAPDDLDDELDFGEMDDAEAEEPDDEDEEESRPRSKSSGKGSASGKGKGSAKVAGKKKPAKPPMDPNKVFMLSCVSGAVVVMAMLGFAIYYMYSKKKPEIAAAPPAAPAPEPEVVNKFDLAYLPQNSELFVRLKVAEAWGTPFMQAACALPEVKSALDSAISGTGLQPTEVESITFGLAGFSSPSLLGTFMSPPKLELGVAVVRCKKDVNPASLKLELEGVEKVTDPAGAYYRQKGTAGNTIQTVVAVATPRIVLVGDEASIKTAMAQGPKCIRRADLDFVDPEQHLLIAMARPDLTPPAAATPGAPAGAPYAPGMPMPAGAPVAGAMPPGMQSPTGGALPGAAAVPPRAGMAAAAPAPGMAPGPAGLPAAPNMPAPAAIAPGMAGTPGTPAAPSALFGSQGGPPPLAVAYDKNARGMSIGVKFGGGFDLQFAVNAATPEALAELKKGAEQAITEARGSFEKLKGSLPPALAQLGDQVLGSLKLSDQATVLSMTTSLPESSRENVLGLPQTIMGMMLTGGLAGLAGGGDIFGNEAPKSEPASTLPTATTETAAVATEAVDRSPPDDYERVGTPPSTKEGIPEGFIVQAKARWTDASGDSSAPLEVAIDMSGSLAGKIVGFGNLKIKGITGDRLRPLKTTKSPAPLKDLASQYVSVDRDNPIYGHPNGGARIRLFVQRPDQPLTKLTNLEGSFRLEVAQQASAKVLEFAENYIGKPVSDPELKQAGFKLKSQKQGSELQASVSVKGCRIGTVEVLDADGEILDDAIAQPSEKTGTIQNISFTSGKLPDSFKLKFTIYAGTVQTPAIPFKFENVPVLEHDEVGIAPPASATASSGAGLPGGTINPASAQNGRPNMVTPAGGAAAATPAPAPGTKRAAP